MRIETLRLDAYGPFTGKTLHFGGPDKAPDKALHIVFGPNEAGKSTILRALTSLLFGFDDRSKDAQLHPLKDLSVAAALRLNSGKILNLTRFKRRKNDLVDGSGQAIEQRQFLAWLGGSGSVTPDLFAQMFGLDQNRLRQGAENLLLGEGDLGQALFAAASGIANLRQIQGDLQDRQDKLFKPRASTTDIHQSIVELTALSKQLRECAVKPAQWKKARNALQELESRQEALQGQIFEQNKIMTRHQRHQGALKHIHLREELKRRLIDLQDAPLLSDDFAERRAATQQTLTGATHEHERLSFRLAQIKKECEALVVNLQLLNAQAEIQRLYADAAAHRKALKDSRLLEARAAVLCASIAEKLDLLGQTAANDPATAHRRLPKHLQMRMESLIRTKSGLEADRKAHAKNLEETAAALAEAEAVLKNMALPMNTLGLETALAKAGDLGNPGERIREIQAQAQSLTRNLAADVHSLGLAGQDAANFHALSLPLVETIARFESELDSLKIQESEARKELERLDKTLLERESALSRLEQGGTLPEPTALAGVRNLRDAGWGLIKANWLSGQSLPDAEAAFVNSVPGAASLCEAFEKTKDQADELADKLFHGAQKVAQAMGLRLEMDFLRRERERVRAKAGAINQALDALGLNWREAWAGTGISPLSPKEMRGWLGKALDIRRRALELQEREAAASALLDEVRRMSCELRQAMLEMGEAVADQTEYAALLSQAKRLLADRQKQQAARRELERRVLELTTARDKAQIRHGQAVQALNNWEKNWAATLSDMRLPQNASPEAAQAAAHTLEEIAGQRLELLEIEKRLADMDREYREFTAQVAVLQHFAPPAAVKARPEDVIGLAHAVLTEEKEKATQKKALLKEQGQMELQLQSALAAISESEKILAQLCVEADCADPAQLPRMETQARSKRDALNSRNQVEERLLELAVGEDLESFIAAASSHDPDELSAGLERLAATKAELAAQRDDCLAEIGRARGELTAFDGTSQAAEINQRIQETRAGLQEQTGRFLHLRLAGALLAQEIERFRQANQGPVLATAGKFFQTMTMGSFSGLTADYNTKGDPVIRAVRSGGDDQRLDVAQLSEGTRDQLFLALRLAGLLRYVQTNPALPLIVDDILVNFDDERSAAAFRVLNEIAASTQVLFFTHHAHLLDIARSAAPPDMLAVHRI